MNKLEREVIIPRTSVGARARAGAMLAAAIVLAAGAVEAHLERYSRHAQHVAKQRVERLHAQTDGHRSVQPDRLHSIPTHHLSR